MCIVIIRYIKGIKFVNLISISKMLSNRKSWVIVLLCAVAVKVDSASIVLPPKAGNVDWWKNATIYQVYTRSFKDTNADGIGDIAGIIEKLDYLKNSGVTAIWLPPIQKTVDIPTVDLGYEIIDYTGISTEFGTAQKFKELIRKAHNKKVGIKIILEIVPNHSSKKHQWFIESEKGGGVENTFKDYYVWASGDPETPPNNWKNQFDNTKSAWTFSTVRQEWYLHQFGEEQPDLNYHYPSAVREEMKNVFKHWLDLGVDGFLIPDVPYLVENKDLEEETVPGDRTSNQEATYDLISEWRTFIDEYNNLKPDDDPRILITKAHTDLEQAMLYCGKGEQKGAHFTYNFLLETELKTDLHAQTISKAIDKWITATPDECVHNWVLGNHDLHRVATRFGPEVVDGLNILLSFLPGIMITYNGEEIGQENGEVKFAQCKDPIACKNEESYESISRDFERTPFHWDNSINAGFSTGTPWLPVSKEHETNNLQLQSRIGYQSHYHTYQALIKLRQIEGFDKAGVSSQVLAENVLALFKEDINGTLYIALINTGAEPETLNLSGIQKLEKHLKVLVANSASKKDNRVLSVESVLLDAYESIVVKALPKMEEGKSDWWKHSVVYQIYPLSFKDSNNDGFGDLKGIISKLEYLKETGITAIWLSPILESPQVDAGYDISNYRVIDTRFGTDFDFDKMVEKAHSLGIKIIMDFVPNHSSNQHQWFKDSENMVKGFEEFYIWREGKNGGVDPPTNWLSLFKGPAWTKSETRNGQWYLHQFAKEQPDLNYRNPQVVIEMKEILRFWMDRGVDGFRMDAVPYLFEDDLFRDEESTGIGVPGEDHESLNHIHTSDLEGTFDMIYQWRDYVDDYTKEHGGDARILMTEAYTDIENTMKYYGNKEHEGAHFTFNFELITRLNKESNANQIRDAIKVWLDNMPDKYVANWVLGNHDNHRVATRFNSKNVDGLNMLTALLPGVMVTYNGEEIGQENGKVSWEQCKDPRACKGEPEDYEAWSRDFERTPFHWNNTINAGFNDGGEPWLPVSELYIHLNLAAQNIPDKQSHYNVYKQLLTLRDNNVLDKGKVDVQTLSTNILTVTRTLAEDATFILFFNVGDKVESIEMNKTLSTVTPYVEIKAMSSESFHSIGELVSSGVLALDAHEGIIVATTSAVPPPPTPPGGGGGDGAAGITISFVTLIIALVCLQILH